MTDALTSLTLERKRHLLRERLAAGQKLPKTYPASYSQRRLWFMHKLAPESPAYNVEAALPLGDIDGDVLERAINAIVARHESLRTTFIEVDGEPIQRVAPNLLVSLERIDLAALSPGSREERLAAIRRQCATEPFDLARGPLVRTRLVRLAPDKSMFLLHLHHILADGWSMGIFSRELSALYGAFAAGQSSPLPPLALQYGDFSVWQRRAGDGEGFASEIAFWTDKLAGMIPLDLPTDHRRPPVQSFAGAFHNHAFTHALGARLEAFARDRGVTLFMLLLTAFKVLLARLASQEDIAVGTYIANRERAEVEGLIGFFLNTLVLRTAIRREGSFNDALQAVKETALGAYANQALPFERLVELLKPPRDLGRNPLVQVVFQLQNAVNDQPGQASALIDYQRSAAAFDLAVTAYRQDGRLHLTCEYATDLFDAATISRLIARLEHLLTHAIAAPESRVSALEILLPDERARLPNPLRASRDDWASQSVTRLFAAAAGANPGDPVFYVGETYATIGQVATCADRIAHALIRRGTAKGDVVAVCLPRSVELAASLMAVWQVGAIYLPLDPAYPEERLRFMIEDSRACIAIVRRGMGRGLPDDITRLDANAVIGDLSQPSPEFDPVPLTPDDPSHIIYTSGSTGRPKGVLSPHRQVLNRLHWMWRHFPHAQQEVEAVKTATSFIDSLWELVGPMIARRPATIVDSQTLLEPNSLVGQLARDAVTRIWLTPSYLRLLLESVPDLGARLPALALWFITGEKLSAELARRFRAAVPRGGLLNLYGTSEAWDICCSSAIDKSEPADPVPVGTPLDNVDVVLMDVYGQPVPDGFPGQLHVGGAASCLGFVNRDELDDARFIAFNGTDGMLRLLSTGDRARRRYDGQIEILGRMDHEVKISGMRIHPAEVEACLGAIDSVATAAVTAVTSPDGSIRLWAWFVAHGAETLDIATIRAKLAASLPAPMVPERLVQVAAMPQTPSGKIDRNVLAKQALAGLHPASEDVRVRGSSDREAAIAAVFAEVLGRTVDPDENFFAAGGHSLLAARAIARINDRLKLDLRIRDFLLDPTAAGLALRAVPAEDSISPSSIRRLTPASGSHTGEHP
ncbi:AMP-binding protein [Rhizobium leguminosarum bv. viciae 248]|uniref:condensation domain-containing protein n=1 Tax=Rhizobium leguminosarum TaxID=384 RepID=UPI000377A9B2|nr:condensation domain-containing protein [Rhizobium leguminosarum]NKM64345.1 AMP-binding protein [Rhizobium leguminosarum bv. viciae]QHW23262.1 AMP-binding protein [Rhizobium leguminosarum bv. viciae 248]